MILILCALFCFDIGVIAQPVDVKQLLDRYAAGDFAGSVAAAIREGDANDARNLRMVLDHNAAAWMNAHSELKVPPRLVVASFALEAAGAIMDRDAALGLTEDEWTLRNARIDTNREASELVEWACVTLRAQGPTHHPAEGAWWLASVEELNHHAGQLFVLFDRQRQPRPGGPHIVHALAAEPDAPELQFTSALGPMATVVPGDAIVALVDARDEFSPEELRAIALNEERRERSAATDHPIVTLESDRLHDRGNWAESIQSAARKLTPLVSVPAIAPEVRLFLGAIALCLTGGHDAARRFLADAEAGSDDRAVKYLAAFLTGRVDERDRRFAEAARAYRRALTFVPRAYSATVALAASEWSNGNATIATGILDEALRAELPQDPWETFARQPYDRWPERLAALHAALRQ